jgi:hypothetical protein
MDSHGMMPAGLLQININLKSQSVNNLISQTNNT